MLWSKQYFKARKTTKCIKSLGVICTPSVNESNSQHSPSPSCVLREAGGHILRFAGPTGNQEGSHTFNHTHTIIHTHTKLKGI